MIFALLKTAFELQENNEYSVKTLIFDSQNLTFTAKSVGFFFAQIIKIVGDLTIFVDNLNMLYIYLIDFFCTNEIQCDFSYKNGVCANVKVKYLNQSIVFVNFKSKFGVEFSDNLSSNWKLIDYAIAKGREKISLGADAYNEFLLTIFKPKPEENANHKLMRENFPIFEYDLMLTEAKRNVAGFQFVKKGWFENVFEYDISSSYPASALGLTPTGLPFYFSKFEDCPKSYFKIIKFTYYNLQKKPNEFDLFKVGHMGQMCLTESLFEEFKKTYICNIHIQQIEAFKTRKSLFEKFIYQTIIDGKFKQKDPTIAKYNKFVGNAIIGYLGRNTTTLRNSAKIEPNGLKIEAVEENIDPIYLPAYLAILDRAKSRFIKIVRKFRDKIIYANTDGFLSTQKIDIDLLNSAVCSLIGNFREKTHYKKIFISSINGYAASSPVSQPFLYKYICVCARLARLGVVGGGRGRFQPPPTYLLDIGTKRGYTIFERPCVSLCNMMQLPERASRRRRLAVDRILSIP